MDVKDYRRQQHAQVEKAKDARYSYTEQQDIPGKGKATADARAEAVCNLDLNSRNLKERIPYLLNLLGQKSESVAVRNAALDMLTTAEFIGRSFADFRPQIVEAVRALAEDKSPLLRQRALEYLAQDGDDYARDILTLALRDPDQAPVKQAKVVQLLGLDDHSNAADLVLSEFANLSLPAQEEAIRILGTDPKSAPLLLSLLSDKNVSEKVRRISAAGLKAADFDLFTTALSSVLADNSDSPKLKAAIVGMAQAAGPTAGLDSAVATAQSGTKSKALKDAAQRYFAMQRKPE